MHSIAISARLPSSSTTRSTEPPSNILNRRHLERVLPVYVHHYSRDRRPHRALELRPPDPQEDARSAVGEICRRDRLGGLIHEYYKAAA